ncbi:MAG: permease prefix domain 1-containing protein [Emergencia sp.]
MEIILNYLETMFRDLPDSPQTRKAKTELASMMEDKYLSLIAEGKSENEAVGTVISEFGNVQELMSELESDARYGGENCEGESRGIEQQAVRTVTLKEAKAYLEDMTGRAEAMAKGVWLCIMSPALLIALSGFFDDSNLAGAVGILVLLAMVIAAVRIFITNGIAMEKYEFLKKEDFRLEPGADRAVAAMKEDMRSGFARDITTGVIFCIASVIPLIVVSILFEEGSDGLLCLMTALLLFMVSIGVRRFIIGGIPYGCMDVLLQKGDYRPEYKKQSGLVDRIASVYWPLVTAVFLGYSFITDDWAHSWIIWPVAAVLFGAVTAFCHAAAGPEE